MQSTRAVRTVDPASLPLSVAEAKIVLGIPSAVTYHDAEIEDTINAAREELEHDQQTAVIVSTFTQSYDSWPNDIRILVRHLVAVSSITYYDSADSLTTLASTKYFTDDTQDQPAIRWNNLEVLPTLTTKNRPNAVVVTYTAGYTNAAAVPENIRKEIKSRVKPAWDLKSGVTDAVAKPMERAIERMSMRGARSTYP